MRLLHPDQDPESREKAHEHESANVICFGANYNERFPMKNLYKALNVIRPDALLVQLSPDILLSNFEIQNLREQQEGS